MTGRRTCVSCRVHRGPRLWAPSPRGVMVAAEDAADELGHGYIGDEHIVLGLLGDNAGPAHRFLAQPPTA